MRAKVVPAIVASAAAVLLFEGCKPLEPNELDKLPTVTVSIKDQAFRLWIADDSSEVRRGLMQVTADQMAPLPDGTERGMLFVFDHEQYLNFWMKDTIIPLDIDYLDTSAIVVATHTMPPLDDRWGQYPSGSPARYAIEVNAGVWEDLSLRAGDHIDIPDSVLKRAP